MTPTNKEVSALTLSLSINKFHLLAAYPSSIPSFIPPKGQMGENEQDNNSAPTTTGENKTPSPSPDGDRTKEAPAVTVVLKLDLHCEGCAKKLRRFIAQLEGVTKVRADCDAKRVTATVTKNVTPTWLRDTVENKIKKKVELISPQPKLDAGAAPPATATSREKKDLETPKDKPDGNKSDDNNKTKAAVISRVVMKMKLDCEGCAHKINRVILKNIEGVDSVTTDLQKNLVTVVGIMEVNKMTSYLQEKLKRNVDIVDPTNINENKIKDGKEKTVGSKITGTADSGPGQGKVREGNHDEIKKMAKMEMHKMEYNHGYNLETHYATSNYDHAMMYYLQSYNDAAHMDSIRHALPPPPPPTYLASDHEQMFSDENPNGCVVM